MMNDARKMFEAKNYSIRGKDTIHSVEKMTVQKGMDIIAPQSDNILRVFL